VNRGADKAEIAYKRKDMLGVAKQLGGKIQSSLKGASKAADAILAEIKMPTGADLHKKSGMGWAPIVTISTAAQIESCSKLIPKSSGAIIMPLQAA